MSYQRVATTDDTIIQDHTININHAVDIEDGHDTDSTPTTSTRTITPGGPSSSQPTLTILRSGLINSKSSIHVNLSWTLIELKQHVMTPEERTERSCKIIYMGRVLKDDMMTLTQYNIEPDTCIQFHLSEKIDTSVVIETIPVQPAETETMTEEELMYQQFWQQQQQYVHATPVFAYDQPHLEMEGSNADFFVGFVLGFLLGFLALIWVWQRAVTRRQKVGILAGIGAYLLTTMLKLMVAKDQQNATSAPGVNDLGPGGLGLP